MPKVVDHEQRRREIAEAALRVVVRDGAAGASVRTVAAEAGWSTGALRYYFSTQRELREFVATVVSERVERRVTERAAAERGRLPLLDLVAGLLEELIPLDERRREEFLLWLAVTEWSRQEPLAGAEELWENQRRLHVQVVFALAGFEGEPVDVDPRVAAWAEYLHVFVDGLATQAMFVTARMPPKRVRAVLREFLAEVPRLR
ncbi:TetR/AcrR family transcriptional regulator [Jiangella sp. DSM 45060]|uniref:TetR/AcrR family transcriptional regulator n=1 Tax=Jiangella sp. DSM 45060 TaxID=1798224 RepID=UPI0008793F61|nr:TetR family transcriptional regulator C-terminal domain-containing protein [Jiangella sp. DSM 45060]SDT71686.1 regulatory protein, tetR family [Jiangella sp. DSM 45060]